MKIESFPQGLFRIDGSKAIRFGISDSYDVRGFLTSAKRGCIIVVAVGIAQLAEHRTVAPTVAGSIPVSHPRISFFPRAVWQSASLCSA